ncbi:nadp-dependent alcohol dehydrogenase-like protein [Stagonosporopsis vannaccii]|nr:nadp-dependent alcohol dehydrogenase-like protein [Stagonosporopsis vannaccii]
MAPACVPAFYRLVFLYLEPVSILAGAVQACFFQPAYLALTHAASAPAAVPVSTSIVLTQLANLYLGLALTEALVLRATTEYRVWRALVIVLLIADVGHLYSVLPLGFSRAFLQYWNWNAIDWGNVGWVYFLALTRLCMLFGIGFGQTQARSHRSPLPLLPP